MEAGVARLLGGAYETREDLIKAAKEFYSNQGYVLSIKSSRANKNVTIGCDRRGVYRNRVNVPIEDRKKGTTTRLTNYPFQLYGKRQQEGFWKLYLQNDSHNHEASKDISGHPSERVFSEEEILCVKNMSKAGTPPCQIISFIREKNQDSLITLRDVYNMKRKISRENLQGRTAIQVLFEEFSDAGYLFDFKDDGEGRLTHIFFAHPELIKLSITYSTVFVMDCTYKTNRYKMPLLEIIGMTSFNTPFYSCFVVLRKEEQNDYEWALRVFDEMLGDGICPLVIATDRELALMNAIKEVFPSTSNLLCVWHIEKNIVAKCKLYFEKKDWEDFLAAWNMVVYSFTEEAFNQAWYEMELSYKGKADILIYLRRTWFQFKKHFVSAWTEKKLHFGTRSSSRAEGAHSKLKRYLSVSTGDLLVVKQKVSLLLENDIKELKVRISRERIQVPHKCRVPFFKDVLNKVSLFALEKLEEQFEMLKNHKLSMTCSGTFSATMGLPCAHMMSSWKGKFIPLAAIHPQWRIDTRESLLDVSESNNSDPMLCSLFSRLEGKFQQLPLNEKNNFKEKLNELLGEESSLNFELTVQQGKGRPSTKRNGMSSTTREPSQFEIVEAGLRKRTRKHGEGGQTSQIATMNLSDDNYPLSLVDLNYPPTSNEQISWN